MSSWPMPLAVGDRVHHGVSSPDTGVIVRFYRNRNRAMAVVSWDKNGERRGPVADLHSVTRSLTEWACYKLGERPCPGCGYRIWEKDENVCGLCRVPA